MNQKIKMIEANMISVLKMPPAGSLPLGAGAINSANEEGKFVEFIGFLKCEDL